MSKLTSIKSSKMISAFWGLVILHLALSMTYLHLYGVNNNIAAFTSASTGILMMMVLGILLSRMKIFFLEDNFLKSAMAWTSAFVIGLVIAVSRGTQQFVMQFPESLPFSMSVTGTTVSGVIKGMGSPAFWAWYTKAVAAPGAEEIFWAIGLPLFIVWMLISLGRSSRRIRNPAVSTVMASFRNPIVQIIVLLMVLPLTFMTFHIEQSNIAIFMLSSFMFRGILTVLWWGDVQFNLVPNIDIIPAALLGFHHGINFGGAGVGKGIEMLLSNPWGWATLAVFGFVSLMAILGSLEWIEERTGAMTILVGWVRGGVRTVIGLIR